MKYLVQCTGGKEIAAATMQDAEIEARKHLMENLATNGRYAVIFEAVKEVTVDIVTKYIPITEKYNIAGHEFPLEHAEKPEPDPAYFAMENNLEIDTEYYVKLNDRLTPFLWYSANYGRIYKVLWNGREFCVKEFPWKKIHHYDCTLIDGTEASNAA